MNSGGRAWFAAVLAKADDDKDSGGIGMKLRVKILAGFGVVSLVLLSSGGFSLMRVGHIRQEMAHALGQADELADLIEMQEMTTRKPLALMEMLAATEPGDLAAHYAGYQRTKDDMDRQIAAFLADPHTQAEARKLVVAMDDIDENQVHPRLVEVDRMMRLRLAGGAVSDRQIEQVDEELDALFNRQIAQLEETILLVRDQVEATNRRADATVASTRGALLAAMIAGLLASAAIGFAVAQAVSRPVAQLEQVAGCIAQGDLTASIDAKLLAQKDEIGSLSRSFAGMAGFLRLFVGEIAHDVETLGQASQELTATATQIEANARVMADNSQIVTGSAEEVSSASGAVADGAQQISDRISTAAASVQEMSASINEVSSSCNREMLIASQSNQRTIAARENVGRLHESALRIDRISQLIRDIADQTNLLALNATIEAASAGDAGRGFAVVADEVKELARQTAKATTDIEASIREIQQATVESIREIDEVAGYTQQLNDISQTIAAAVEEQAAAANEISSSLQRVSGGSAEIANSVGDSTASLEDISRNVRGLDGAIRDTVGGVARINQNVEHLTAVGRRLKEQTAKVKLA
ncbi:MAG: methyl-accepting chemotaxis protein [bacterium]|nr:methyl-accepting chemotaxis protein [bacterium]